MSTFRYKRRRLAKSPAVLRRKRVRRVNNRIRRYVKTAIDKSQEDKHAYNTFNATSFNGAATAAGDLIRTMPVITQGDTSYTRDGMAIRVKKMVTKGFLKWQPNGFTEDGPIYATLWLVVDKLQKNFNLTTAVTPSATYPNDIFHVLKDTLNVPTFPSGDWRERVSQLRTDRFKIVRKTFKLSPNYTNLATTAPFVSYGDQDGFYFKSFSMTTPLRKGMMWKYATDGSSYPENFNTYMFVSFSGPGAPTGYSGLSNVQMNLSCNTRVDFEDA